METGINFYHDVILVFSTCSIDKATFLHIYILVSKVCDMNFIKAIKSVFVKRITLL